MKLNEKQYHLTFDIDWAPDQAIADICNKLGKHDVKASFFITHESDIIKDLVNHGHNIGLHPNFFPNSSQGEHPIAIIEYLLEIAPNAISIRSHGLFLSSPLLLEIAKNFPQIKYDLSIFMYKFPTIAVTDFTFDGTNIKRINYNWEDDIAFFDCEFNWNEIPSFAKTMVLDFHPIHVALNSNSLDNYNSLKQKTNKPLHQITKQELDKYRNPDDGADNFLDAILSSCMKPINFAELTGVNKCV